MIARRRIRLRLLLRDLAAGFAFASMAISGLLPIWVVGIFAVAFVLGLLGRRLLSGRGLATAVLLAIAGLALYAMVAFTGFDLVLAACSFAGFISAQRMLAPPSGQTDAQVHLTSLLMIAGGAALSADLLFAVALAAFAVTATFSLGLAVLEDALPEGADFPLRPLLWRLAVGALAALVGSALFFFVFPRLSWNVAARKTPPGFGQPITGIADRVRMKGGGTIKENPRVVLRVQLNPDPGESRLDAYWVGTTFDSFDGEEWRGTGAVLPATNQVELGRRTRDPIHQRIELLPAYGSRTLVALEPPTLIANVTAHSATVSNRVRLEEVDGQEVRIAAGAAGTAFTYHAYSARDRDAWTGREEDPARFLGLPPRLDPRVAALAARIAGADRDPLATAHRLQAYLQAEYRYTLELSDAGDPLADFLFDRKEGHCEHFATALAVMLRTLGIPARVAGGFYGGERVGDYYVIRAGDAHAWTQVLVPGRGFVTVDATPPSNRSGMPNPALAWLTAFYEKAEDWWRSSVVDYDLFDQAKLARSLVRRPASATEGGDADLLPKDTSRILGALGAALLVYALFRLPRRFGRQRASDEATALLDEVEELLAKRQIAPAAGEGIEELATRLEEASHPLAPSVRKVTRRYLEARFGGKPLRPGEREHCVRMLSASSPDRAAPRA